MGYLSFVRKNIFRFVIISLTIAALVWFFFHLTRENDFKDVLGVFNDSRIVYLVFAFVLMVISLLAKGYRFYILLKPSCEHLSFKNFLLPFFVGYGFSTLGPLKSGEIASIEINKRTRSIPRTNSLAALALFRIIDLIIVLIFFVVAFAVTLPKVLDDSYTTPLQIVFYISLIGTIILSFILFFPAVGKKTLSILEKLTKKISARGADWLNNRVKPSLDNYYSSLKNLITKKKLSFLVLFLSIFRWVMEIYSFKLTLLAFGVNISFVDAAAISAVTMLVIILTLVPAGLGTGSITTLVLLEGLLISPIIAGASIIYQTLCGTGLTLSVAAVSSIFLKKDGKTKEEKEEETITE
ncbi:MAG: flippase-like domain-containing protein [Candidatus Heimdallarchaeota archaeon]|nr:flippase-like domain-containing protein [Candidatus Heimdallarchaeota archaeon]